MPTVAPPVLEEAARRLLAALGAPAPAAAAVAASLVEANVLGVDSHGVLRLPQYASEIDAGLTRPDAEPAVEADGATVRVDGRGCFGQLAARAATVAAAERAAVSGIALATVSGVRHVGRLGEYVELAASKGLAALAFCNAGPPGGRVAPYLGRTAVLGTNPLAYAFPTRGGDPVVADFSTAAVAEGRVRLARDRGEELSPGWIVDSAGAPSTDPAALYRGGAILPAGGHKGFALGLLCELLGGVVAGAGCASLGDDPGNGLVLVLLRLPHGASGESARVGAAIRSVPAAPGHDGVLLPGDPERAIARERGRLGIPLADETWAGLETLAARLRVEIVP